MVGASAGHLHCVVIPCITTIGGKPGIRRRGGTANRLVNGEALKYFIAPGDQDQNGGSGKS